MCKVLCTGATAWHGGNSYLQNLRINPCEQRPGPFVLQDISPYGKVIEAKRITERVLRLPTKPAQDPCAWRAKQPASQSLQPKNPKAHHNFEAELHTMQDNSGSTDSLTGCSIAVHCTYKLPKSSSQSH